MDTTTKILLIVFVVLGVILAFVAGRFVINMMKGGTGFDSLFGSKNPTDLTTGDAAQTSSGPASTVWDGKSRVNILLLGLDYSSKRASEGQGSPLSDTMMLATVDPVTQTIGVMSIRRDLWVNIPGYGYNKINEAYKIGEDNQLPGGGPQLAVDTVEELLGVPINFYARVDFKAFTTLIDQVGGIEITLQQRMLLDWKGNGNKFWIEPGTYIMPGSYVLAYARTRDPEYGDGDFARGSRQMEVITALRDRVFNLNNLPTVISKAPAIYNQISSSLQTNMNFDQAIQLAYIVAKIPRENMHTYNIDTDQVSAEMTGDGVYILRVIPEQLRILRDEMFNASAEVTAPIVVDDTGTSTDTSTDTNTSTTLPQDVVVAGDPLTQAVNEGASIEILNGTNVGGLADSTRTYLQGQGLNVVSTGNADQTDSTTIIYHNNAPYAVQYLAALMQVTNAHIYNQSDPNAGADVTVILGPDWAAGHSPQ